MNTVEHGFKVGSEITVLGRAYRGRANLEYYPVRIERVVRATKNFDYLGPRPSQTPKIA